MMVRCTMDLFQHRYYRLSKILMTLIGQWPYQSTLARCGAFVLLIFLGTGHIVPRMLAIVKYRDDWRTILDCIIPSVFDAISATKLFCFMRNSQKTLKLLNSIRKDWQVWAREQEVNILHEYTEQGYKITLVYTVILYLNIIVFMTQPIMPNIIDVFLKNGTLPAQFPSPSIYYQVDVQKYYIYIVVYYYICALFIATISIAGEVMLIIYVQHVCGIFAAVGHKVERIGNNDTLVETRETSYAPDKRDMIHLASCVYRHNDAIEYANLIEATYTWIFFFVIIFGMILINATGLQILVRTNDPDSTARFIIMVLSTMLHFYIDCYISQLLLDHSTSICFYIHNSKWYRLSAKTQKQLQFMMMRCNLPCQLTAGKILVMSVSTFWLMLKTAMSYFTFVRSM